ncbi:MAG: hypothetical protein JXM71_11365, partial [Spirochaetales bacterium]|nr:hypothetical protein [Spirochaetales bacterium]
MHTTGSVRLATLAVVALAAGILTAAPIAAETAWPPLGGDLPVTSMVESDDIRRALWTSHYTDTIDHVLSRKDTIKKNAWGSWTASVDTGAGAFYIIVAPERGGSWPVYAQGSWIVKRSSADGSFMQAKIFLRSDPGTFVRVYPAGSRSRMDIIAYGGVLYREVPVPLPFADLLRSPFSRIRHLTADVVDWDLFSQDPALYADLLRLSDSVSAHLPELRYADDGAIDYDGSAVYISTLLEQKSPPGLNCSGFVKWLVDGILHPITGEYLSVAMLRERMTGWRGSSFTQALEEAYDPFFGLDWS